MRKFGDGIRLGFQRENLHMDNHVDILMDKRFLQKELPNGKYLFDVNSYYFNMDWLYYTSINNQKLNKYFQGSDPDIENNMCAMNISYVLRSILSKSYNIE